MVRSVAGNLPEQVKNNQSVNTAAGNGGQKMSQYSWFTVYLMYKTIFYCTSRLNNFLEKIKSSIFFDTAFAFIYILNTPAILCTFKTAYKKYHPCLPTFFGHALDRLVAVSSIHYCTSTSALSTSSSSRGLTTLRWDISS